MHYFSVRLFWRHTVCAAVLLGLAVLPALGQRNYHPYAITDITKLAPGNWHGKFLTHIEIQGWVTYLNKEGDGDTHIRICDNAKLDVMDGKHCMVAEIIPTLQPKGFVPPKKGMHLLVRGIGRYDAENPGHHWFEVHPVEEMEVLPASS